MGEPTRKKFITLTNAYNNLAFYKHAPLQFQRLLGICNTVEKTERCQGSLYLQCVKKALHVNGEIGQINAHAGGSLYQLQATRFYAF